MPELDRLYRLAMSNDEMHRSQALELAASLSLTETQRTLLRLAPLCRPFTGGFSCSLLTLWTEVDSAPVSLSIFHQQLMERPWVWIERYDFDPNYWRGLHTAETEADARAYEHIQRTNGLTSRDHYLYHYPDLTTPIRTWANP